ncbi:P2X purinoceptor 7-like [Paramisgurnus dabryanus]|uniref:P2X purinoceptor 7-like n=1 Tax=Paramisgurnus dabryanus TaxID=90735 RepID=UPI0031F3F96B
MQIAETMAIVLPYQFEPESDPESSDEQTAVTATPPQARLLQNVSQWCLCGNCARMPNEAENLCCKEIPKVVRRMQQVPGPPSCMIHHPGFEPNCLNPYTLQNIHNIYSTDYGPLRRRTLEEGYRYTAYRSFVSWCWGYLGRHNRVVIPSCVVLRIRLEFPDQAGRYVCFRPPLH